MGFFRALASAAVNTVSLPVAIVKDVATLGGVATGRRELYTASKIKDVGEDLDEAVESITD